MKKILVPLLILCILLNIGKPPDAYAEVTEPTNFEVVRNMGLGYNLGKTFAQVVPANQNMESIKRRINIIREEGFTTLRIPVAWTSHIDGDGHIQEDEVIRMLQKTVKYAYDKGMYIVLSSMEDLGEHADSHWDLSDVDKPAFKAEYKNMWKDICTMFSAYDYHLVFSPYNEPKNYHGSLTTAPDGSAYTYGYTDSVSRSDTHYFAGRCGNIYYIQTINSLFASIMQTYASDRFYFVSSYNAAPKCAYYDYSSLMYGKGGAVSSFDYNLNGGWGKCWLHFPGVNKDKAIFNCHLYASGETFITEYNNLIDKFSQRNINLPIFISETGMHTADFIDKEVADGQLQQYLRCVDTVYENGYGICLWDDTQSMSYMNSSTFEWINKPFIDEYIRRARQTSPDTTYVTEEDLISNVQVVDVPVEAVVENSFIVRLPATINMEKTDDSHLQYNGRVGVKGSINVNSVVIVEPQTNFYIYDVTLRPPGNTLTPSDVSEQDYDHREPMRLKVNQAVEEWPSDDLDSTLLNNANITYESSTGYFDTNLSVESESTAISGKWEGILTFDIVCTEIDRS